MPIRLSVLFAALVIATIAAVVLYALAPSGRFAWLTLITLAAPGAGLLLARVGRARRPGSP